MEELGLALDMALVSVRSDGSGEEETVMADVRFRLGIESCGGAYGSFVGSGLVSSRCICGLHSKRMGSGRLVIPSEFHGWHGVRPDGMAEAELLKEHHRLECDSGERIVDLRTGRHCRLVVVSSISLLFFCLVKFG